MHIVKSLQSLNEMATTTNECSTQNRNTICSPGPTLSVSCLLMFFLFYILDVCCTLTDVVSCWKLLTGWHWFFAVIGCLCSASLKQDYWLTYISVSCCCGSYYTTLTLLFYHLTLSVSIFSGNLHKLLQQKWKHFIFYHAGGKWIMSYGKLNHWNLSRLFWNVTIVYILNFTFAHNFCNITNLGISHEKKTFSNPTLWTFQKVSDAAFFFCFLSCPCTPGLLH